MAVIGSGIAAQRLSPGDVGLQLFENAVATAFALMALIWAFGPVSGAHFNPAVTAAFLMRREIAPGDAAFYVAAQAAGGLLGVALAHVMFEQPALFTASGTARSGFAQVFSEGVAAFGLVLTILMCLKARADAVAWAVGLYIVAGYWFTASTSFANPAVTVARSFTDTFSGIRPEDAPAFIAAQFAGAALAAGAARLFGAGAKGGG